MIAEPLSSGAVHDASSHVVPAVSVGADGVSGTSAAGPGTVALAPSLSSTPSAVHTPPASHVVPSAGSDTVTASVPDGATVSSHSDAPPSAFLSSRRARIAVPFDTDTRSSRSVRKLIRTGALNFSVSVNALAPSCDAGHSRTTP